MRVCSYAEDGERLRCLCRAPSCHRFSSARLFILSFSPWRLDSISQVIGVYFVPGEGASDLPVDNREGPGPERPTSVRGKPFRFLPIETASDTDAASDPFRIQPVLVPSLTLSHPLVSQRNCPTPCLCSLLSPCVSIYMPAPLCLSLYLTNLHVPMSVAGSACLFLCCIRLSLCLSPPLVSPPFSLIPCLFFFSLSLSLSLPPSLN